MNRLLYTLLCVVALMTGGCTSGQQSPTDSHPGSGSVKEDPDPKDSKATDTTQRDSAKKYN